MRTYAGIMTSKPPTATSAAARTGSSAAAATTIPAHIASGGRPSPGADTTVSSPVMAIASDQRTAGRGNAEPEPGMEQRVVD